MDLEQRVAELEQLVQEQGEKIAALEVEAQKRQCYKDQLFWGLKQLLPLQYKSCYLTAEGRFQSSWHMWLGKVFAVKTRKVNFE